MSNIKKVNNNKNILSLKDIKNIEGINENAVKFYLKLVEERFKDTMDTKKQIEQKTSVLLGAYLAGAIALFGIAQSSNLHNIFFNITATILFVGSIPLFLSLKTTGYGTVGRHPSDLLKTSYYITIKESHMPKIYVNIMHNYIKRIDTNIDKNGTKAFYFDFGVLVGLLSSLPFFLKFLFGL